MGPWKQIQSMFHRSRAPATVIYITSIIATLYAALVVCPSTLSCPGLNGSVQLQKIGLTILMVIVQVLAMLWYGLSFIPFAQTLLYGSAKQILPL
jgi:hypothetical protein